MIFIKKLKALLVKRAGDAIIYIILGLMCVIILYPIYYMFIISVSAGGPVVSGKVLFYPIGFNWESYKVIFADPSILRSFLNSVFYTVTGTVLALVLTSCFAYPLAQPSFWHKKLFNILLLITMFFSGGLVPSFIIIYSLGMYGTIWAIIIPSALSSWNIIIMRTFFSQIPKEINESAYMDGANEITIFLKIIIPISKAVFATILLFCAVGMWNSYFPALMYLRDKLLYPITIILRRIVIQNSMTETPGALQVLNDASKDVIGLNIKYAVTFIVIVPILALYPLIQKHLVKGALMGSLKG